MSKDRKTTAPAAIHTRVNTRALIILGVVAVVGLVLILPISWLIKGRERASAMAQAEAAIKRNDKPGAMRLLTSYLRQWPTDIKALSMQAKLTAETAFNAPTLLAAATVNDQLLRLDPNGPEAHAARRRIINIYIAHGERVLEEAAFTGDREGKIRELRFPAAEKLARTEVKDAPQDAEAHRLLALSLDGEARAGDESARTEAIAEFEAALKLNPTDALAARQLAMIYADKGKKPDAETNPIASYNPAAADRVMDELLKADPKNPKVRMVRRDVAQKLKRRDQMVAEINAAVALAPDSQVVRFQAAQDSLEVRDTATARQHLDAMPKQTADSLQVRLLRGRIDFTDLHPEEAIDQWRKGLSTVGGSDSETSFLLAYMLIQLGRMTEAQPLIDQYKRLTGNDTEPMCRLLEGMFDERVGRPAAAIAKLEPARDKGLGSVWESELYLTLGRCYATIGDEDRALTAFRRAISEQPNSFSPRRAIARLIQAKDPDGAIAEMERGIAETPEDPSSLTELVRMIVVRQLALPESQRKFARAEQIQTQAEKIAPNAPNVLLSRVEILAARNRLDEAVALLTRATAGPEKRRPELWQALTLALIRQGKTDQALKTLDQGSAADVAGDHAEFRILRARLLIQTGHAQAAKDLLAQSADGLPSNERPTLARARGDLLRDLGDRDGARRSYAEWARLSPEDSLPGLILVEMGQQGDAEATQLGLKALRDVGGEDEPYGLAAKALALLADPRPGQTTPPETLDKADQIIAQIRQAAPQLPIGHLLRGVLMERRQRLPEAIAEYKLALRGNTQGPALAHLVQIYTRTKKYDELTDLRRQMGATLVDRMSVQESLRVGDKNRAEQIAAQLVEGQPDSLAFRTTQAQLLRELGRPLEAQETLRELTIRQPNQPGSWLALLLFQVNQKDIPAARSTLERLGREYKGERPDLLIARGQWLVGEKDQAAKLYEAALAQHPNDSETLKSVAEFYEGTGRVEKSEEILRHALKTDPAAGWARRWLATLVSARNSADAWAEAWSLIGPDASGVGDTPEDRLVRATVLARSPEAARRAEALPAMQALIEDLNVATPVAVEARTRLGQEYINLNRPADAARVILPVADDRNAPNPTALAIAVEALSKSNQPDEAQVRLDRLVELEPKTSRTVAGRAWLAHAQGKDAEAASLIVAHLPEIEKTEVGEVLSIAFLSVMNLLNQPEATEKAVRIVVGRWPRDGWILGRLLLAQNKLNEGLDAVEAAIAAGVTREAVDSAALLLDTQGRNPAILPRIASIIEAAHAKNPKVLSNVVALASVRHFQGRLDDEIQLYRDAAQIDPTNAVYLNNMAWTLCEGKGQAAEGLKAIDEAVRRVGRVPELLDTRGTILTRLNRNDEAIKDLEDAVRVQPNPTNLFHLARAYKQAGRETDRKATSNKARARGFNPTNLDDSEQGEVNAVMAP